MKNIRVAILSMMAMIVATGYAVEESQGPINIFTIPTKNYHHRRVLEIFYEGYRNIAKRITVDSDLILAVIRAGRHDLARQMRMQTREQGLQLQEEFRQQAQQVFKIWGYLV